MVLNLPRAKLPEVIRTISVCSCSNSACRFERSVWVLVPSLAETASSDIRCSMSWIFCIHESAVEMYACWFWMFVAAMAELRIWDRMRSLMARPAGSSAADTMRNPLESLLMESRMLDTLVV